MNDAKDPPSHDLFLNVRKAYRLLHDYQCMVLDAIRYIADQIEIEERGGLSRFAGDAKQSSRLLSQPSWDWLPMMAYEFHFANNLGNSVWLSLSFLIFSDTGFIEGVSKENSDLAAYKETDKSSTKFAFILYKSYRLPLSFIEDKLQIKHFITTGGALPDGLAGKCYDLSSIACESDADNIVTDVIAVANEKSWPLNLKKKTPSGDSSVTIIVT
jgi:hypothetical protein